MTAMRAIAGVLGLTLLLTAAPAVRAEPPYTGPVDDRSKICMMQDSVQAREGIELKHGGKSYFFCCSMCETKFNEDPDRYAHATDPVSGVRVDKANAPIYAFEGRAFFFQSGETLKKFAAAPEQYARRAH
jgi:YHS domain-containing protein